MPLKYWKIALKKNAFKTWIIIEFTTYYDYRKTVYDKFVSRFIKKRLPNFVLVQTMYLYLKF